MSPLLKLAPEILRLNPFRRSRKRLLTMWGSAIFICFFILPEVLKPEYAKPFEAFREGVVQMVRNVVGV